MAKIGLRHLLIELEEKLKDRDIQAVILGCQHILQHYPKNAAAYRMLGHALLENKRWEQAQSILYRLLGVTPNDFDIHSRLGQVYLQLDMPNHAAWHYQRAHNQDRADESIIQHLRALHPDSHPTNFTLDDISEEAVAWEHLKAGRSEQAIDVLNSLLVADPERVGIQAMLAQALWKSERRVDASNHANSVLRKLPFCLEMNLIQAQVWTDQSGASGTRKYFRQIAALDPYLAYELAEGSRPDDSEFVIEAWTSYGSELDRRSEITLALDHLLPDPSEYFAARIDQWIANSMGTRTGSDQGINFQEFPELMRFEDAQNLTPIAKSVSPGLQDFDQLVVDKGNGRSSLKQLTVQSIGNSLFRISRGKNMNDNAEHTDGIQDQHSESGNDIESSLLDHDHAASTDKVAGAPPLGSETEHSFAMGPLPPASPDDIVSEVVVNSPPPFDESDPPEPFAATDQHPPAEDADSTGSDGLPIWLATGIDTPNSDLDDPINLALSQNASNTIGTVEEPVPDTEATQANPAVQWLDELGQGETHYIKTLPDTRFAFSDLPIWLRNLPDLVVDEKPEDVPPFKRKRTPTPETLHTDDDDDFLAWLDNEDYSAVDNAPLDLPFAQPDPDAIAQPKQQ